MKLIEVKGNGFTKWYWENHEGKVVSPQFSTKERADEWYGLHDTWLERPAIIR
jgi:hypothetical protein